MKRNLDAWLNQRSIVIEDALSRYATDHIYFGQRHTRIFPLSDLGLCGAVRSNKVELPSDYRVQEVSVRIKNNGHLIPNHCVGYGEESILDFVPGQFFTNHAERTSGIAYMLKHAPQLLHVLSPEVVVLHATICEALEELGIAYIL